VQLDSAKRELIAANLGDSGFVVIRDGAIILRSRPLEHHFDCPLQFGCCPEFTNATDKASSADLYLQPVQPGDVIVAGSDGLWDNVYDADVLAAAAGTRNEVGSAVALATKAREHASDPEFESPYVREATKQGFDLPWPQKLAGMRFTGGKLELARLRGGKQDDITVIVSRVDAQTAGEVAAAAGVVLPSEVAAVASVVDAAPAESVEFAESAEAAEAEEAADAEAASDPAAVPTAETASAGAQARPAAAVWEKAASKPMDASKAPSAVTEQVSEAATGPSSAKQASSKAAAGAPNASDEPAWVQAAALSAAGEKEAAPPVAKDAHENTATLASASDEAPAVGGSAARAAHTDEPASPQEP